MENKLKFYQKIIPILKAVASGLIWGLGQVFNRQFRKALFFFLFFACLVGIELLTSRYFEPFDAFTNKIDGEMFSDNIVNNKILPYYDDAVNNPDEKRLYGVFGTEDTNIPGQKVAKSYPSFDAFLAEHRGKGPITIDEFITFVAQDLTENNPSRFFDVISNRDNTTKTKDVIYQKDRDLSKESGSEIIVVDEFFRSKLDGSVYHRVVERVDGLSVEHYIKDTDRSVVLTKEQLFGYTTQIVSTGTGNEILYHKNNKVYRRVIEGGIYEEKRFFVNINDTSEKIPEHEFYDVEHLKKNKGIYLKDGKLYVEVIDQIKTENNKTYWSLLPNEAGEIEVLTAAPSTKIDVKYRLFKVDVEKEDGTVETRVYEWFNPEAYQVGYQTTPFTEFIKKCFEIIYTEPGGNRYTKDDYTKFLLYIYFKIHPEMEADFTKRFDNFFFDHAGFFTKGIWSLITLGDTDNMEYDQHQLIAQSALGFKVSGSNQWMELITVKGHDSAYLMIRGIISTLLLMFFMIIWIWNIRDAYLSGIHLVKFKKRESDRHYFKEVYERSFEYIILFPAIFLVTFISIMPIIFGFLAAFTNYKSNIRLFDWVGFSNFVNIFSFGRVGDVTIPFGKVFWSVFLWTVIWAVFSTVTVFFGGFFQALIINNDHVPFKKFWRTLLILPWAVPAIISQMVFNMIFNETGVLNATLESIGVYDLLKNLGMLGRNINEYPTAFSKLFYWGEENIQWFHNPHNKWFVRTTLIVVNIWLGFPYYMALMSGVMVGIDRTLYEAAEIDGATKKQRFRYITFPLVMYSTAPLLVMSFSGNFNNFGVIYFITEGGANAGSLQTAYAGDTDILISWMYTLTVDQKIYNMASVFSILIFIVVGSIAAWNYSQTRAFKED